MFKTARLKLTAWYLLIIMAISLAFSGIIYRALTAELDRFERAQRARIERRFPDGFPQPPFLDPELVVETKGRIGLALLFINLAILGGSSLAGYFLAGKTLKPIESALEEQKRFTADASHELRTPLTTLKTEIEVALRDKQLDLKRARKLLGSNLEEVNKMQQLSNYLLTLNKYAVSGIKPGRKRLDLAKVSLKAINKVLPVAKDKQIRIKKDLKSVFIKTNEASLVELIGILLDNAVKYSPKNKVVLVKVIKKDRNALLSVEDQGIGIKASELPYIFNRFYRADASRSKEKIDGFGLGLSIAKTIAETNGIKIKVSSQPHRGSVFTLVVPLA